MKYKITLILDTDTGKSTVTLPCIRFVLDDKKDTYLEISNKDKQFRLLSAKMVSFEDLPLVTTSLFGKKTRQIKPGVSK